MSQNPGKPPSSLTAGQGGDKRAVDAFLEKVSRAPSYAQAGSRGPPHLCARRHAEPPAHLGSSTLAAKPDVRGRPAASGGLDVQLVYFRGLSECRASRFVTDGKGSPA